MQCEGCIRCDCGGVGVGRVGGGVHRECNARRGWVKMGRGVHVELHYNTF